MDGIGDITLPRPAAATHAQKRYNIARLRFGTEVIFSAILNSKNTPNPDASSRGNVIYMTGRQFDSIGIRNDKTKEPTGEESSSSGGSGPVTADKIGTVGLVMTVSTTATAMTRSSAALGMTNSTADLGMTTTTSANLGMTTCGGNPRAGRRKIAVRKMGQDRMVRPQARAEG